MTRLCAEHDISSQFLEKKSVVKNKTFLRGAFGRAAARQLGACRTESRAWARGSIALLDAPTCESLLSARMVFSWSRAQVQAVAALLSLVVQLCVTSPAPQDPTYRTRRTGGFLCHLRGGAAAVAPRGSSPLPLRQGSDIGREKPAASEAEAASLTADREGIDRTRSDDDSEVHEGVASINTKYASIIAKRKVKLNSLYDVDFRESGVLGTGTFSTVRVATHKDTGMQYAVKAINLTNIQPQTLIRLRREIQVLRSLNHKNIIQLYEIFEEDGMLLMIMELCTGGELWHFLQRVEIFPNGEKFYYSPRGERIALTEAKVAQLIRGIVEAIQYCHSRGVSHRDLKLENLMLRDDDDGAEVKLIDFGFSKLFKGGNSGNTMFAVLGSPYYVAPEVLRARPPTSEKPGLGYGCGCDMWSIGVIAYMILCGQAPFDGETDQERLVAVKRGVFKYPAHANLSREAADFVNALLTINPTKRLTARAALEHPFLQKLEGAVSPLPRRGLLGWMSDAASVLVRDVMQCCSVADGMPH